MGNARYPAYVVDCTGAGDATLASLGLVADVNRNDLGHKEAVIILW